MGEWSLSVSELNEYVRRKLAGDAMLRNVSVRGEIVSFKRHVSGHLYFTLKDEQARVSCAMFRQQAARLDFQPADGMQVVVTGAAGLYPAAARISCMWTRCVGRARATCSSALRCSSGSWRTRVCLTRRSRSRCR